MNLGVGSRWMAYDTLEAKEAITGIFRLHANWRSRSRYRGSTAVARSIKASIAPNMSQNAACLKVESLLQSEREVLRTWLKHSLEKIAHGRGGGH